jgi:hypothetical protein
VYLSRYIDIYLYILEGYAWLVQSINLSVIITWSGVNSRACARVHQHHGYTVVGIVQSTHCVIFGLRVITITKTTRWKGNASLCVCVRACAHNTHRVCFLTVHLRRQLRGRTLRAHAHTHTHLPSGRGCVCGARTRGCTFCFCSSAHIY